MVSSYTVKYEIPFCIGVALLVGILGIGGFSSKSIHFSRVDGIILIVCFILFLFYTVRVTQQKTRVTNPNTKNPNTKNKLENISSHVSKTHYSASMGVAVFIISLSALIIGGRLIVDKAVFIAHYFEISQRIIAIVIISVGTSLPELVVSLTASLKKQHDIAMGNIIGSNIFNVFFVLGISILIQPIVINNEGLFDIVIHLVSVIILYICILFSKTRVDTSGLQNVKKIGIRTGIILTTMFIFYIIVTI